MKSIRETKWFHFPKCRVSLLKYQTLQIRVRHIPASQLPLLYFFSSFKKRHHNFPIGVSTLVEGTNQKENLSSQVRILLFENVGCEFFQQDGIQDSNSVTECIAGLTRICLQKGRIYIQPLGRREGKAIESFSCICCFLIAFSSVVSRASQVALWLKKKKSACKCRRRKFDSWTGKMP